MKKVFVFCVGGTGLRVMKSIVMMMAGGMNTNGYTVVPILVDPHQDLEEKKNLQSLVDEYHEIHNRTIHDGQQILNPLSGFFHQIFSGLAILTTTQTTPIKTWEWTCRLALGLD